MLPFEPKTNKIRNNSMSNVVLSAARDFKMLFDVLRVSPLHLCDVRAPFLLHCSASAGLKMVELFQRGRLLVIVCARLEIQLFLRLCWHWRNRLRS